MAAPKGNKFAVGNSGKPKMFATPDDLQKAIDEYFENCDNRVIKVFSKALGDVVEVPKPTPYTIEGICEVLECDRLTLLNYEKKEGYEEYFNTIKKAKLKVQKNKIERGLDGDSNPAVSIFDLKNNHGYKDKMEFDVDQKTQLNMPDIVVTALTDVKTVQRLIDEEKQNTEDENL